MENFKLNNGVEIPCIGLGVFRMEANDDSEKAIETALSIGYRHIDTASYYENEEVVGKAVKNSGIPREEIFITTKIWNDDMRSGKVMEALEDSLRKMDTDYVDLYLIHWPVPGKYLDTWRIFEEIYKSGKARSIGVSNFQEHHIESLKEVNNIVPVVNQIELHPYFNQEPLLQYCKTKDIYVQAWSPFAANQTGLLKEPVLVELGEKYSKTSAQIILRWNYQRGVITLPKSSNRNRLEENISIFDFELTNEDMQKVNSLNKEDGRTGPDPDNFDF